jgi:hypothetical protein
MGKNVTMGYDGRVIWGAANDGSAISTNTPVVGYLDMLMRDHFSFQIITGSVAIPVSTLVGNLVVECSNDYVPPGGGTGQIPNAGNWSPIPNTFVPAYTPTGAVSTTAGQKGLFYSLTLAVRWVRFTFTQTAGSGVLIVFANAKSLGG